MPTQISTTTTTTNEQVNWEVVWGADEADRILYVDEGDGSWLSQDAEARATRKFLELLRAGVRVGFYKNGTLDAGRAVAV